MGNSKVFFNDHPLVIPIETAILLGLNEAIVLQQLHYWIKSKGKEINGEFWIYNTYEQWHKNFTFWSIQTIRRILTKLKNDKLIKVSNFNRMKQDNTNWYTIDYDECKKRLSSVDVDRPPAQNEQVDLLKMSRPPAQNGQTVNHETNVHETNHDTNQRKKKMNLLTRNEFIEFSKNALLDNDKFFNQIKNNLLEFYEYKKEVINVPFRSKQGVTKIINQLFKYSNGSKEIAIEIIDRTIASEKWPGIYPVNGNNGNGKISNDDKAKKLAESKKKFLEMEDKPYGKR